MSHSYTDRFGYPLTAAQALGRMKAPKRRGYYDDLGRWVKLPDKKPKTVKKQEGQR